MHDSSTILCDGCGQPASPEHTARRLQRLEWATRYRPIHLHTLLLGAVSPESPADFLYSPNEIHSGEAAALFIAAGIEASGKTADAMHSEFQRRGLFLTHILECPLNAAVGNQGGDHVAGSSLDILLTSRLPMLFTRIRRSLKPKRLALISKAIAPFVEKFAAAHLDCEFLDDRRPFAMDSTDSAAAAQSLGELQQRLAIPASR
jgi:hypothetical protein